MTQISTLGRSNDLRGSLPWQNRPRMENRELGGAMECSGAPMLFRRHAEIYGEGEPADYLYKVVTGVVRTYKVLADGRRQVGGFCLPGDIFGLEIDAEHAFSAETISECRVLVAKHSTLIARAKTDHEVAFQLWMLTGRELRRLQDHLLLLIKNAPERVAAFLLALAERSSTGNSIELPMSRQDIADHLGLTIETVSRTLTYLESIQAIELISARRILLRDRRALVRLSA
jgi:CRP/FNR family transcriptional regulator, nitrogen fixation regulation protein